MIMPMKFQLLIALVVLLAGSACKVDPSAASANANANTNANVRVVNSSSPEPESNCALTMAGISAINNVRLGMTPDEVLANLPGGKDDPEVKTALARPASSLGVSEFVVHADKLQPKEKYTAINHFTFTLLDGKVSSINIGYNGPAYSTVDEFVSKVVQGTSLPPANQWQAYPGMETQLKTLSCKDFEMRVYTGGEGGSLNYVLLTDLEAGKKLKDRRAKARAQASPSP